jgi:hypothetical protein
LNHIDCAARPLSDRFFPGCMEILQTRHRDPKKIPLMTSTPDVVASNDGDTNR